MRQDNSTTPPHCKNRDTKAETCLGYWTVTDKAKPYALIFQFLVLNPVPNSDPMFDSRITAIARHIYPVLKKTKSYGPPPAALLPPSAPTYAARPLGTLSHGSAESAGHPQSFRVCWCKHLFT